MKEKENDLVITTSNDPYNTQCLSTPSQSVALQSRKSQILIELFFDKIIRQSSFYFVFFTTINKVFLDLHGVNPLIIKDPGCSIMVCQTFSNF
jgi:hypothetical protein